MNINDPTLHPWPLRILLGCFIFGVIGLFTFLGVVTPGMGWFLYFFLIPFWAMFPIIILGVRGALVLLATYVIGYPIAKLVVSRSGWYAKAQQELKTRETTSIGGIVLGGGASGGGWFSSSGSGGGFSGGVAAAPAGAALPEAGRTPHRHQNGIDNRASNGHCDRHIRVG